MEEQLIALENEIETIKRMVNGFVWQNPALEGLEVEGLCFKRRGEQLVSAKTPEPEGDAVVKMDAKKGAHPDFCKICTDANGDPYMYCFPGPCPKV